VQNRQHRFAKFHDLVSFVDKADKELTDQDYSGLLTAGRGAARAQQPTRALAVNIFTSPSGSKWILDMQWFIQCSLLRAV